jgi:lysophospholipase L1-like esterase
MLDRGVTTASQNNKKGNEKMMAKHRINTTFNRCLSLAVGVAVMVSASRPVCGTDEVQATKDPVSKPNEPAYFLQPRDVVLFLGNSITAMAKPELDFLKTDFQKQYPELADGESAVKLVTAGINGEQAGAGAKRLKALLEKHKPTVCVVCYGTCEVTFKNEKSFIPAMKSIIQELKGAHVAVTIVSAPPPSPKNWKQPAQWPASQFVEGVPEMVKQAKQLAADEGLLFVDAFAALTTATEKTGKELSTDGIHLNADGYRVMADALQKTWGFGGPLSKPGAPRPLPSR